MSSVPYFECYREPLLPESIRLLRLLPNEDKMAPIQCELFHYPLQKSGRRAHPYEALSYVWGGSDKPQSISIRESNSDDPTSGHDLPVTENLNAALAHLRYPFYERIMWIDAVCINQNDEREKEQQIQFMAKIYALANRVVVWLGEAAENSDQALHWIRDAGGKNSKIPASDETIQQAVIALLQRPWFRRIWILQEVAAARRISIMCGPTEIDGYAFCLGMDLFEGFNKAPVDLQSLARSVTYLIRGAIFRSEFPMGASDRTSLDICPLGELIDMYHAHEATKRHDKVFALLGMSSDDLSKSKLLPDYRVPWKQLLQRLTKYILGEEISVEVLGDDREIAVIESKGCVLGKVIWVQSQTVEDGRECSNVFFENGEESVGLTIQASAKSVRPGDIVCLLQEASRLTIIRRCRDHFDIIIIAAKHPENIQMGNVYVEWPGFLQSKKFFIRSFILHWDWEISLEESQHPEGYDRWLRHQMELPGNIDKATQIWNLALILGDLAEDKEADEKTQEAIEGYQIAFGLQNSSSLKRNRGLTPLSWAAGNGYTNVVSVLLAKDGVDPDWKDSYSGRTPLSWAAERGHEAVVKLLLDTGKVDVNLAVRGYPTPLSWAVEGGHEAVVKLLLETGKVKVNSKDWWSRRTPLSLAAERGHETMVKLLLEAGKVEVDSKDRSGRTPFSWAAERGHEAVIKLLLETGKVDADLADREGWKPLAWAAEGGHEAVVKLLLETGQIEVNSQDNLGQTPLLWAAKGGHETIVKLLLEMGKADVDPKDKTGRTPLWWAAEGGFETIVKLLLETGKIEVNSQDNLSRMLLLGAARRGHEAIVKLLQSNTK